MLKALIEGLKRDDECARLLLGSLLERIKVAHLKHEEVELYVDMVANSVEHEVERRLETISGSYQR